MKEGEIDAASTEAALDVLQKNELFPISIREEQAKATLSRIFMKYMERVTSKELMIFFRQLAILIEARVPIVNSLVAIREQTSNLYFRRVLEGIINDIQDGLPISDALAKNRDVFSGLSINIIRAGEVSGNLKKSVSYVADSIEKNYILTSKIRSALLYPVIVLTVFLAVVFVVVSFIIPKLTSLIKELNTDIPWYTQMVIVISEFMAGYWWAVLTIILGAIGGAAYYFKTEDGRKEWDQVKIKIPVFGKIFRGVYMARFADNLAVLLSGGIPIIRALTVVSTVIHNSLYQAIVMKAAEEVKRGGNMSDSLRKSELFPSIVSQMVKIGEESGQIDLVLRHVANFYEQEVDETTKNLSTLIEPVLMIIIGIGVGFLAFAVIMPIYDIASKIQ